MIRKSFKYFFVAVINMVILVILMVLWTDRLELFFNKFVRPVEFFKIIGITILCLIGMRIQVQFLRKRKVENTTKRILFSVALTLIISSYLYLTYSIKIANVFFSQTRHSLIKKVYYTEILHNDAHGDNLTYQEYLILARITRFPNIPQDADQISFQYHYDYFLPDYLLELNYEVSLTTEIEEIHVQQGYDSSIDQTFKNNSDTKHVTYREVVR